MTPSLSEERRVFLQSLELRAATAGAGVLDGYACVFNAWTQIGGDQWGFMERVAPGAFTDTIQRDDIGLVTMLKAGPGAGPRTTPAN